jgi:osmotically-inducible protein OsmY
MAVNLYQSEVDRDISERVVNAIHADKVVRESRVPLEVEVRNAVVEVRGLVLSETMRDRVLYAAAATPGVSRVIDRLKSDPELETGVAHALAGDTRLAGLHIAVSSFQGIVTLTGSVPDAGLKAAALDLASQVPGVRQAIDRLTVQAD